MTKELVFYTNPQSRGRIAHWMLEEVGVPYRTQVLEYNTSMKDPEYLRINPMGKVPAIVHDGVVVTECAAVCAYLADAFPEAGLAPPLSERGAYYRWLFFAAGPLELSVTLKRLGKEPDADQQIMLGHGNHELVMDALEHALKGSAYLAGSHFSAADVYLGAHLGWNLQYGVFESRPVFTEYTDRIRDRDAYRRANALAEEMLGQ